MTSLELEALRSKYVNHQFSEFRFAEASEDVNAMLDALPESPRNTLLRKKYADTKAEYNVAAWIVQQDIELLAKEVVPIDPEPPEIEPPAEISPSVTTA